MVQAEWPDNLTDRKYKKKTKNKQQNKKRKNKYNQNDNVNFAPNCLLKKNYGENDMIISLMAFFKKESNLKFAEYHNIKINPVSFGQIT